MIPFDTTNENLTEFAMFCPNFMFDDEYTEQASQALERQKNDPIGWFGKLLKKCENDVLSKQRTDINERDIKVHCEASDLSVDHKSLKTRSFSTTFILK